MGRPAWTLPVWKIYPSSLRSFWPTGPTSTGSTTILTMPRSTTPRNEIMWIFYGTCCDRQMLLEDPAVNPNLQANHQTALHIAVSHDNLKCAKLLLERGASPNVVNSRGLTPLHVAAMRKNRDMVKLIFDKTEVAPDLDSYRDYDKNSTRDVLKRMLPDLELPPRIERPLDVNTLQSQLTQNDEKSFLQCIDKISNITENDTVNLIEIATKRNFESAVSLLLTKGIDGRNLEKAAIIATEKNSPVILRLLLNNIGYIRKHTAKELLFTVCDNLGIPGNDDSQDMLHRLDCLRLILERDEVTVRCTNEKGNSPLHYAARADNRKAIMMLLAKGSYIGHVNKHNSPPVVADIYPPTLSEYFDESIRASKEQNKECMIEFDYKCLKPHDTASMKHKGEMGVFQYLAGNVRFRHLLKHPLLSSFIHLKWQRIFLFFVVSFILHFLIYSLLNSYIILVAMTKTFTESNNQTDEGETSTKSSGIIIIRIVTSCLLGIFALWKLFMLGTSPRCFVSNLRNWIELVLLVLEFFTIYDVGPVEMAAPVTLLSAWHLVFMMGQYSYLSTDIEILKTVSLKFLRLLAVYGLLIFAFALAFFVLFKHNENFLNPFQSLFKTIVMLAGEFNANDIPFMYYPYMSHAVFVLFIFLIFIVLLNLLNGLAVNDISEIIYKADLIGLVSRIGLISYVENTVISKTDGRKPDCKWRYALFACLADKILLFPKQLVTDKFSVELYRSSKMDGGIISKAREILSCRNRKSDTKRIIDELDKVKVRLASIESSLNTLMQKLVDKSVNIRREGDVSS
ncbi:transient receptor potential cation channel protein painless-like isoform X2 [Augochlora pura]